MNPNEIQQIVEAIKNLSALAWQAAQGQVRAELVLSCIWMVLAAIVLVASLVVGLKTAHSGGHEVDRLKKEWAQKITTSYGENSVPDWSNDYIVTIGSVFTGLIAIAILTANLNNAIQLFLAPDYAAIHKIIQLVPGR